MRSWISRSFKNALVSRLVCDGALSSCMRMHSSMEHGGVTMPFTIAAPTAVPGFRWLCLLMHTSRSRSACRGGRPRAPVTQIGLFWLGPVRKKFSSENTMRIRSKGCRCRLLRIESTPTRCSTSRQKIQPCLAVFRRQSRRTDGLEAPRSEIFVSGAPQLCARHFQ